MGWQSSAAEGVVVVAANVGETRKAEEGAGEEAMGHRERRSKI